MSAASVPGIPAGRLDRHAKLQLLSTTAAAMVLAGLALRMAGVGVSATAIDVAALISLLPPLARVLRLWRHPAVVVRVYSALGFAVPALGVIMIATQPLELGLFFAAIGYAANACSFLAARSELESWWASAPPRGTTLSVAVICKDEVDRIGRLLEAVKGWADEIVVLDSGSKDGTVELARRYTDEVEVTDWPGYGAQKQRALERCSSEWVLSLDADEVPSDAFKREVDAWLAASSRRGAEGKPAHSGFKAHWVSVVFGGPIDFGADGRYHTRLLRRAATRFDGAVVHEEALVDGRVATLESPVYHHTFRDDAHMWAKLDEYSTLSAKARFAKGKRSTVLGAKLRGAASFVLLYVVRLGVLDGARGLRMALAYAGYTHDKYAKLVALERAA